MNLYGFAPSPNCRKVSAVVFHLDLQDVDVNDVAIDKGASRSPNYLSINPNGKVPALVDGDFALWESNAICEYLCDRANDDTLLPRRPRARADVARWLFWEAAHWQPAAAILTFENFAKRFLGGGAPDLARVKQGEEQFHASAKVLDEHLAARSYLVEDRLTLADFVVGAMTTYREPARLPLANYGHIRDWIARLDAVPAWKRSGPPPM